MLTDHTRFLDQLRAHHERGQREAGTHVVECTSDDDGGWVRVGPGGRAKGEGSTQETKEGQTSISWPLSSQTDTHPDRDTTYHVKVAV